MIQIQSFFVYLVVS